LQAKLASSASRPTPSRSIRRSGKKTRVRAGPFASRDAAEKALEKMKRIGVSGVISGK
jgi:DedD protein